jgi:enoyl-CoA hydratase/carnithine racemase
MTSQVLVSVSGHKATLTLSRPRVLNAMSDQMVSELKSNLQALRANPSVKVLVINGDGNNFCAGADIREWVQRMDPATQVEPHLRFEFLRKCRELFFELENLEFPVIASISGYCLGGGLELAMSCDLRIASQDAKFGQPEINLGAIAASSGTQRLPRLVGVAKAKEMILLGDIIDAIEAERIGLVNRVVPNEQLDMYVNTICEQISEKSRIAMRAAKFLVNKSLEVDLQTGIDIEARLGEQVMSSEDAREGYTSFVEKRKTVVRDR